MKKKILTLLTLLVGLTGCASNQSENTQQTAEVEKVAESNTTTQTTQKKETPGPCAVCGEQGTYKLRGWWYCDEHSPEDKAELDAKHKAEREAEEKAKQEQKDKEDFAERAREAYAKAGEEMKKELPPIEETDQYKYLANIVREGNGDGWHQMMTVVGTKDAPIINISYSADHVNYVSMAAYWDYFEEDWIGITSDLKEICYRCTEGFKNMGYENVRTLGTFIDLKYDVNDGVLYATDGYRTMYDAAEIIRQY